MVRYNRFLVSVYRIIRVVGAGVERNLTDYIGVNGCWFGAL